MENPKKLIMVGSNPDLVQDFLGKISSDFFSLIRVEEENEFTNLLVTNYSNILLLDWDYFENPKQSWFKKWLVKKNRSMYGWILLTNGIEIKLETRQALSFGIYACVNLVHPSKEITQIFDNVIHRIDSLRSGEVIGNWFDFDYHTDEHILDSVHKFIHHLLMKTCLQSEEVNNLAFAIHELLLNAFEHGNHQDPKKKILISYVVFENKIVIKIQDEGSGFIIDQNPDPLEDPVGVALERKNNNKRPGGYGIKLTKQFVDQISYNDKGNLLVLTKTILRDHEKAISL